jgi:very-short-patch-repair endonuclease
VAQYLERGKFHFDLLVLDEASQMRPEDALGAMARCGRCVIVGDNKQLPPTSFFEVSLDGAEPEEGLDSTAIQESESILDAASSLYQPSRMLRWHYRSKHPSLIAFSNAEFYGNELILFPSIHEKSAEYGVKFIEVPGVYGGSKNEIEAETVVAAVLDQLRQRPAESLGVAAMNSVQANLIEELLEKRLREDPLAQATAERWDLEKGERVFVKNLENVQGDERDVIFISITYGRDAQGVLRKNFGPINGRNGGRRLNVLFSRARKRVQVYASFTDADLALTQESSAGAQSLKRYLEFARTGKLPVISLPARPSDSIFEDQVRAAVEAQGFACQPQVGTAGYFIDLAVRDPDSPGSFVLALECDGASYHSSKSARDRDRLRQGVLEGMGWRVHRVWSTDWFRNPQGEVTRICAAIETALKDRPPRVARGL